MRPDITFNLAENDYKEFIEQLRNRARDPNRSCYGRPVLPVPPTNPHDAEYIIIELIAARSVTVKIRRHDLYLIGYQMENGTWFEFSNNDETPVTPQPRRPAYEILGFDAGYGDMGRLGNLPQVGYFTLENAINNLAHTTNDDEKRHSLRALVVMISEAARFEKLSNTFAPLVQGFTQTNFEGWMDNLIHHWGDLSHRLLIEDTFDQFFQLLEGSGHALTTALGILTRDDAVACLGILLGSCSRSRPRPRRHRRSILTTNNGTCKGMGQPLVEVFSVSIDNIDNENPGDLYGTIKVTDGLGSIYLYNRTDDNSESIRANDVASLTGPDRSISLCGFFSITIDLKDYDLSIRDRDEEVSKGSFSWDIFRLFTNQSYYDKRLNKQVAGKNGSATVYYTMFSDAVQAKVDVVLEYGDGEDPADVYGTLVAHYDNYDYSTPEQKKYYQTTLFNKSSSNYVQVNPNHSIPLSRYVVAVQTTSLLIIEADLWDQDSDLSPDDEIAMGAVTFAPQTKDKSEDVIHGRYGSVRVTVTWSPVSQ